MTSVHLLLFLHYLSLFLMTAGLGAVMVPLWRGWREDDIDRQIVAFEDASTGHKAGLLPGTIAVGATGVFLAGDAGYNFFTTGWLLLLEIIYLLILFVCIPLLGHALNQVEIESLKSKKKNEPTAELRELLDDNVPIVLTLLILFLLPVMVWIAEYKPF
ncbi:MAG TPA: DUF2269 family protein [Dehalococcoidia bacterium]